MSAKGVCLQKGGCLPNRRCTTLLDRMTDPCENFTFLRLLLRTVKIMGFFAEMSAQSTAYVKSFTT